MNYKDNTKTVDLILQKPIGILNILKDACKVCEYDDAAFVQNLKDYFGHHSEFSVSKSNPLSFTVNHFAGKVRYDGTKFLSKSKEALSKSVFECLQKSQDNFLADFFANFPLPNGSYSKLVNFD